MTREEAIITLTNTAFLLRDGTRYMKLEHEKQFREAYDMAIKALEQPEQRWIPCSERLPDEDYCTGSNHQYSADVLITVHNADDEETIIDYGHSLDGVWHSDTTDCIIPSEWEVIAWMPLPEPWKGLMIEHGRH